MSEPAEHNRLTVCASHLITLP
ncbi:MAG: hypothetical protein QOI35_3126, partial [Cryptosporangiaceae bacterium]|nr:hypothetical protein [Cryptosporangiaceae bacterium]